MNERNSPPGSSRLEQYHRRTLRTHLRQLLSFPLMVLAGMSLVFLFSGATRLDSWHGGAYLLGGVALGVVVFGMIRCETWSRWPAMGILSVLAIAGLWSVLTDGPQVINVFHTVAFGLFAGFLALPSTGRLFEDSTTNGPEKPETQGEGH